MQVILLETLQNLGDLGDVVTVRPGYGRNYLIPEGKAVSATAENRKRFEERRAELERVAAETRDEAIARAEKLQNLSVVVYSRAGEQGKLFGSVGTSDIAHAVNEAGIPVEKREVRLPAGPLRQLGEYEVDLQLHPEVTARITVCVTAAED